jgi:hypothetical protein
MWYYKYNILVRTWLHLLFQYNDANLNIKFLSVHNELEKVCKVDTAMSIMFGSGYPYALPGFQKNTLEQICARLNFETITSDIIFFKNGHSTYQI